MYCHERRVQVFLNVGMLAVLFQEEKQKFPHLKIFAIKKNIPKMDEHCFAIYKKKLIQNYMKNN